MIAESYKYTNDKTFEDTVRLSAFESIDIKQNEDINCQKESFECENVDELYLQIKICWTTLEFESLFDLLQQLQAFIDEDDFKITESFFDNQIDYVLFSLISNIDDNIFFISNFELINISISIIQDLFIQFASYFPQDSILNFIDHAIPIIDEWENKLAPKILKCFEVLCKEYDWVLTDHIDCPFFLNILDQHSTYEYKSRLESYNYTFFYDGDDKDQVSSLIKQILLKVPPSIEYLSILINDGNCENKPFSIFLWILIKDSAFIASFEPSLYLPKIQSILEKSHDFSLLFPCIIFLGKICDLIADNSIILQLFSFIRIIKEIKEVMFEEIPESDSNLSISLKEEIDMVVKICSITLHCISCFISCNLDNTIFCVENGIIDLILENIDFNDCQNQIKREAAKCLCNLIINTPINPILYPFIQQFYENEDIINLLFNILEYDENNMNELILNTLILLIDTEDNDFSFLLAKCSEIYDIFLSILDNENDSISKLAEHFLDLYENKSDKTGED